MIDHKPNSPLDIDPEEFDRLVKSRIANSKSVRKVVSETEEAKRVIYNYIDRSCLAIKRDVQTKMAGFIKARTQAVIDTIYKQVLKQLERKARERFLAEMAKRKNENRWRCVNEAVRQATEIMEMKANARKEGIEPPDDLEPDDID